MITLSGRVAIVTGSVDEELIALEHCRVALIIGADVEIVATAATVAATVVTAFFAFARRHALGKADSLGRAVELVATLAA